MKKKKKNSVISYLAISGIGATIGVLTGFGLSFTALSPLIMGGIVGSITPALFTALCAGILLYEFCKKGSIEKNDKDACVGLGITTLAGAVIGVGLAAATMAIFPGATLGMGLAALAGAVIAPIAAIAGMLVAENVIAPIAKKVNEYIISPIVERFSSKGEEYNLPAK